MKRPNVALVERRVALKMGYCLFCPLKEILMSPLQIPMNSGFGPKTEACDVMRGIDLTGKIAIVTGGASGLGLVTCKALAEAGATVIVPARDVAKARRALSGVANVEVEPLDLLDPASIERFSAHFLRSERALHLLINSAGIMATPLARDARGYEAQLSANHLGHFQLAVQLWPALQRAQGARVVAVSSGGHRIAAMDFEDPNFQQRPYEKWTAYGQSKSANALFALGLDQRGKAQDIRGFSVHPGTVLTDLARHLSDEELQRFGVSKDSTHGSIPEGQAAGEGGDYKTPEQGAATALWCATSPQLQGLGGVYCLDADIARIDSPDRPGVATWACDIALADRLWTLSEQLTGVRLA